MGEGDKALFGYEQTRNPRLVTSWEQTAKQRIQEATAGTPYQSIEGNFESASRVSKPHRRMPDAISQGSPGLQAHWTRGAEKVSWLDWQVKNGPKL
jgi:hypothetical protein